MALQPARRASLAALCVVVVAPAATLLRYPYLQNVRHDRATILWTTAEEPTLEGAVEYSTDRNFSGSTIVPAVTTRFGTTVTGLSAPYFQHQAELTGLNPGTEYSYRILVDDQNMAPADDLRFRTAGPGRFTFLVFGDSGQDNAAQRQVAQLMLQERPALVLHTGDLAYENGTFEQFQRTYFNYYRDLMKRAPFFPTPGNHDYNTNQAAPYLAMHAPPTEGVPPADRGRYYSFDWGNVHFVSLDSNAPLVNAANGTGAMLQWLDNDLQRTRQAWKVVYFHHAPYATANHENDPNGQIVRERVVPILDRYSVDLVLSGHEHSYDRTYPLNAGQRVEPGFGVLYVITGGGGGTLYPVFPRPFLEFGDSFYHYLRVDVDGTRMTLSAIEPDGQGSRVRDSFPLEPRFPLAGDPPKLSAEGVVNAASFTPRLAPGMIVSLFGQDLAARASQGTLPIPLPIQLSGANVTVNGRRLPLFYASPTQINAQLLFGVLGRATLRVTTPVGSAEVPVVISESAPGIFLTSPEPAVLHQDGTLVSSASPARAGETISIFLTGLGDVNGDIAAGEAAPAPPLTARGTVQVQIGNQTIAPLFAGLAPGFAGLYQVNVQVPQGLAGGTHPMRIIARNVSSNEVTLSVR